jgi:hypothetical protein
LALLWPLDIVELREVMPANPRKINPFPPLKNHWTSAAVSLKCLHPYEK